jgi:hypothetical protein
MYLGLSSKMSLLLLDMVYNPVMILQLVYSERLVTVVISRSSIGLCNPKLFRMCPLVLNLVGRNPQMMLVFQVLVDKFYLMLMKIWVNILILLRLMRLKLLVLLLQMLLQCSFR